LSASSPKTIVDISSVHIRAIETSEYERPGMDGEKQRRLESPKTTLSPFYDDVIATMAMRTFQRSDCNDDNTVTRHTQPHRRTHTHVIYHALAHGPKLLGIYYLYTGQDVYFMCPFGRTLSFLFKVLQLFFRFDNFLSVSLYACVQRFVRLFC